MTLYEIDPLFEEIIEFVQKKRIVSENMIQKHFRTGYARTAHIFDELEQLKIIDKSNGKRRRKVINSNSEWRKLNKQSEGGQKKIVTILIIIGLLSLLVIVISYLHQKIRPSNNKDLNETMQGILCRRNKPYSMRPEFQRSLSLVLQRLSETETKNTGADGKKLASYSQVLSAMYSQVFNCLDIQYANSKSEISGAEGIFYFSPSSTKDRLKILVSPEYRSKDDILTAILLSHEIHHAYAYSTNYYNKLSYSEACYMNEADAFRSEVTFFLTLNQEEQESFWLRAENNTSSKAYITATQLGVIMEMINKNQDLAKGTMEFVKSDSFYKKECNSQ